MSVSNIHSGDAASPSHVAAPPVEVTDARGRRIRIRKINALDRMRVFSAVGPDNATNGPFMGYALLAASVIGIDGSVESLPRTLAQIETMVERLSDFGLEAVATGHAEHFADGESGDPAAIKK
jgi:hypothetical protein